MKNPVGSGLGEEWDEVVVQAELRDRAVVRGRE